MRRIREVLRLRADLGPNLSAIAAGARLARSTVRAYLGRAAAAGLDGLPASLHGSATAEALQAVADLDLEALAAIEPPRGYGRD